MGSLEDEVRRSQIYVDALQVDVKLKISCLSVDVGDTRRLILDCPKVTVIAPVRIAIKYENLITTPGGTGVNLAEVELVDAVNKIHDFVAIGAELRAELKDIAAAVADQRILTSPTVEYVVASTALESVGDIVANDRVVQAITCTVDAGTAHQLEALYIAGKRVANRALDLVGALIGQFDNLVSAVVDRIGVVATRGPS